MTEGVTSSLSASASALGRRRRSNTTTLPEGSKGSKGQPLIEKIAAEFSAAAEQGSPPSKSSKDSKDRLAEAVVVTRGLPGRRRRSNSTLLERVLLSGGSVPPFANGRVVETVDQYVERVVNLEATAAAQNATTVPAGFGEPAAQDPDEWW